MPSLLPAASDPLPLPAAKIGDRYTALGVLGRGGTADVFRVRDERTGRELALKRLRAHAPERRQLAIALFEREYYTLAQLAHPAIIQVHEYGIDDEGAHYTMELLEGADLLALGKQPWRDACRVLRDVASALGVLHSRRWLHRDLSPRNVFITREGRAKLIDFGAMTPMGVAKSLVGTPPIIPPEALQQQSLDGQADLYSLGALAYFMLTGRHAFPARTFDDLRDLWRSPVRPPDRIVPDVPPALSRLVLELLALDRSARPASAASVIELLDSVLGDAHVEQEQLEISRAYFAAPKLVGRDQELARVRERLVGSMRGRGAVVLVEGEPGGGRSRFLDACVLEARLLGASVLRADAGDGTRGDHGVIAALGEQLIELAPALATEVAALRRAALARVIPSLAARAEPADALETIERRHIQTALRDWFRDIARSRRIVIAVDDVERIDEPSLAVLAALAHKSERRSLVLVATVRRDAPASPALELLRTVALRIELPALSEAQTEALLESVFGRGGSTGALAQRAHELSSGNPRQVMALAEHLAQRGLARYVAGRWTLPNLIDTAHLPASIGDALASRIAGLDPQARALAEMLALADPRAIVLSDYHVLCEGGDRARTFKSLDALVEAGVLSPEGERYRFAHVAWRQLLIERLDPTRARELHARLAQVLHGRADLLRVAHHMLESGQEREAIDLLLAQRKDASLPASEDAVVMLQRATQAADALEMPARNRLKLRIWLLETSGFLGNLDVFVRFAEDVMDTLAVASGVRALNELDPSRPAPERVREALALAQARHDRLPEHERSFAPLEAVRQLARLGSAFTAMASISLEPDLLAYVPSMATLASVIPTMRLVDLTVEACADHLAGRYDHARTVYQQVLARLESPESDALDVPGRERARMVACYALGVVEAAHGMSAALERVAVLEQKASYRVSAWMVRKLYHATRGDLEEARHCERRARLLLLQDGSRKFPTTELNAEANTRFMSDDLDGVHEMLPRLQDASDRFPRRRVLLELAHCHRLRLKGEFEAALERLLLLLHTESPEHSVRFAWTGATHLMLLNALGRHAEAAATGRHYLQASRNRGLELVDCAVLARPLAEACACSGDLAYAIELSEALLSEYESLGASALSLGSCCEVRARVAIAGRDASGFQTWFARCRHEYERARNPALSRKLARLLRDAELALVIAPSTSIEPGPAIDQPGPQHEPAYGTVMSRMQECLDARERARCALALLLEDVGASEGHLYGWLSGRLCHMASIPEQPAPADLESGLQRYIEGELRAGDTTARGGAEPAARAPATATVRGLQPALLSSERDGETVIAAAALIGGHADAARRPAAPLLSLLAQNLLEHDDVDTMTHWA